MRIGAGSGGLLAWGMRILRILAAGAALTGGGVVPAQQVTPPYNPTIGPEVRDGGTRTNNGVSIRREPAQPARKVTYVVVSPVREWHDVEDRSIRASLVAFDNPARPDAENEEKPPRILVRAGKVRLWVEGSKTVSEFPLSRLSDEDQRYVRRMAEAAKRPPAKPEPEPGDKEGE